MTNHPTIDRRRVEVRSTFSLDCIGLNGFVCIGGRRSDPSRDSSSFSSMCSGNGGGSLSATDVFCQGKTPPLFIKSTCSFFSSAWSISLVKFFIEIQSDYC